MEGKIISSYISNWLISICGIVIIGVLVEVIMPQGRTTKFVKSIVGIFTVFILILPFKVIDLDNFNFDISKIIDNVSINQDYVDKVEEDKIEALKKDIINCFEENGFYNITLNFNVDENDKINTIYVDLKNAVLIEQNENINKYTKIIALINKFVNISGDNIVFYE